MRLGQGQWDGGNPALKSFKCLQNVFEMAYDCNYHGINQTYIHILYNVVHDTIRLFKYHRDSMKCQQDSLCDIRLGEKHEHCDLSKCVKPYQLSNWKTSQNGQFAMICNNLWYLLKICIIAFTVFTVFTQRLTSLDRVRAPRGGSSFGGACRRGWGRRCAGGGGALWLHWNGTAPWSRWYGLYMANICQCKNMSVSVNWYTAITDLMITWTTRSDMASVSSPVLLLPVQWRVDGCWVSRLISCSTIAYDRMKYSHVAMLCNLAGAKKVLARKCGDQYPCDWWDPCASWAGTSGYRARQGFRMQMFWRASWGCKTTSFGQNPPSPNVQKNRWCAHHFQFVVLDHISFADLSISFSGEATTSIQVVSLKRGGPWWLWYACDPWLALQSMPLGCFHLMYNVATKRHPFRLPLRQTSFDTLPAFQFDTIWYNLYTWLDNHYNLV